MMNLRLSNVFPTVPSLGRLDMAKSPRHPTLREAPKIDRLPLSPTRGRTAVPYFLL